MEPALRAQKLSFSGAFPHRGGAEVRRALGLGKTLPRIINPAATLVDHVLLSNQPSLALAFPLASSSRAAESLAGVRVGFGS